MWYGDVISLGFESVGILCFCFSAMLSNLVNVMNVMNDGNNWRRIELTRCWRNMSKQQYKYRLAICICLKMWNELLPMHIMNDTCTQLHMMRVVFWMRRFTRTKRRAKDASCYGNDFAQESNAGAHPSTSSWIVRLLPPAPAWLSRRQKRRSKACARKHAGGHHPIVDTQRHDPGTRCDQSRKKGWYVKCIKMYALTMVMYTWHWQTSQVQIHRHSGDHTWNRWN